MTEAHVRQYAPYLSALLRGDREVCRAIVEELIADDRLDIKSLYVNLFQHSLYEVGDLWARNMISVDVEHYATAITESLLPLLYPKIFGAEHIGRKAIVTALVNEFHQIGAKMVADIMELNGWDAYFIGANTAITDLLAAIETENPDLVALSMGLAANFPQLIATIEAVHSTRPQLPIVAGGQGFRAYPDDVLAGRPGVTLIRSLYDLEVYLESFA